MSNSATGIVKWFNEEKGFVSSRKIMVVPMFLFTSEQSLQKVLRHWLKARKFLLTLSKARKVFKLQML